ncbi:MAG: 3-isopropylmalate dehydrogenase, partial [Pseudomonadota bacterium]
AVTIAITVLAGDGIGPEVTSSALKVLEAAAAKHGLSITFDHQLIGGIAIDEAGDPLPDETVASCQSSTGVLLGAVGGPKWDGGAQRPEMGLLRIRQQLGLFANLRPVKVFAGLEDLSPVKTAKDMDILIVRELTGGVYFGERVEGSDYASDLCGYSADEVTRLLKVAFDAAQGRNKRVTSVDKANVLATSRLWRHHADNIAADYQDVTLDHELVDAMAMHLVTRPASFDVVVTENLFGDVLSDEAAAISGSIGLAASASLGLPGKPGLYEPIHGSAPDIAGKGVANPAGAMLSAAMLLRYGAEESAAASDIEHAVEATVSSGLRTRDLGGDCGTSAFTDAVLSYLA